MQKKSNQRKDQDKNQRGGGEERKGRHQGDVLRGLHRSEGLDREDRQRY